MTDELDIDIDHFFDEYETPEVDVDHFFDEFFTEEGAPKDLPVVFDIHEAPTLPGDVLDIYEAPTQPGLVLPEFTCKETPS